MKKSLKMLLFMVALGWLLVTPAFAAYQQPLAVANEELESTAGHILPVDAHSQDALAAATEESESGLYYTNSVSPQTDNDRQEAAAPTAVIVEYTGGTSSASNFYVGQAVTIPSGNSYNNIKFNLLVPNTAHAEGNLYILSAEYLGTPANLASSPNVVASSTNVVNNQWVFDSSVTLQGGTQYFFYTNTKLSAFGYTFSNPTDYCAYSINVDYADFIKNCNLIFNFQVHGDAATVIELSSFSAEASDSDPLSVFVSWETAAEIDNAGFNLHRGSSADGPYTQINEALIAATGQPDAGQAYSFMDKPGTGTFFYKLEDIDINGNSSWHGPVSVDISTPTAVSLNDLAQQEKQTPYVLFIGLALVGLVGLRKMLKFAR